MSKIYMKEWEGNPIFHVDITFLFCFEDIQICANYKRCTWVQCVLFLLLLATGTMVIFSKF